MRLTSEVNSSLVSKLSWTMLTNKDSLWVRVLGGKYLRGQPFKEAGVKATDSWIWNSIIQHREALVGGLCYKVGNDSDILDLKDSWVSSVSGFKPTLRPNAMVEQDHEGL